jgi:hypothetical protein
MSMTERYGVPPTRIISVVDAFQYPFQDVQKGDRILILTDDAMDCMVWQAAMTVIKSKGGDPVLCMYPRRAYHCADPAPAAIEAARGADVVVALTTTALNSGTPGLRHIREIGGAATGKTPVWLMEELTAEILVEGGGRARDAEIEEIVDLGRRIGEVYDKAKWLHVSSKGGTSITADISGMPQGYHAARRGQIPFRRNPKTGKLGGGTWPFGEVHVEPQPGTANGTIVWDVTAHHPAGRWVNPVTLTVKDGTVVAIDGSHEANQIRWYLETYGDENSWKIGGEFAIGTNHLCLPNTFSMRSEKKRYGQMHLGIGHGSDRGLVNSVLRLEGIIDRVTVAADDTVVCDNGKIVV